MMNLLDKISSAGVAGAGGAGFPTHVKLNCKVEYLLINAAECEPLLYTDKYLLNNYPHEIIEAIEAVAEHISAEKIFIGIKKVNEKEIVSLYTALQERNSKVLIFPLDNYYPAGDEQMLVYDITGRTVPPGGLPLNVGAVVSNAATMLNIYDALRDKPVIHKYLTVTGEVHKPMVLKVPIGTSFETCIKAAGGSRLDTYKIISGGPMMGKVLNQEVLSETFVTKTTSGIIVVPAEGNFVARTEDMTVKQILNRAKSACIQCSFCTDLCPRKLIGHNLKPHLIMRQMAMMDFEGELPENDMLKEALVCCECGVCETFACPMALSPRQVNKFVKGKYGAKGIRYQAKEQEYSGSSLREYRKIAPKKIMARMGLAGLYNYEVSDFKDLTENIISVSVPVSQHIGAPAESVVSTGDFVEAGQIIAKAAEGKLSLNIHASISGTVVKTGTIIEITGGVK